LGGANVNATTLTGTTVSVTGNITGGNVLGGANVNATTLTGTTVSVTGNITAGNVLGGANVNATTHTGTTASLSGNINGGNIISAGVISATGNSAGLGTQILTLTDSSTVAGSGKAFAIQSGTNNLAVIGNITNGSYNSLQTTGDIALLASGTSVGNVGFSIIPWSGASSGIKMATSSNVTTITLAGATVSATSNVSVSGNISAGNISATGIAGTLSTASQTAITGVGTLTAGTWNASVIQAAYIATLNQNTSGYAATVSGAAQANITSLGTLTGLTINNATTAITNAATTGTGNIGASGATFNTVFAKATTAQYADLAEMYTSDADYEPGTVMEFGGDHEITISTGPCSDRIAGVVSTNPAHLMNSTQTGKHVIAVALTGRVPTRVTGKIWKGAMMVSAGNGQATACATPAIGTVIGKSLEDFSGNSGMIHVVVGRL